MLAENSISPASSVETEIITIQPTNIPSSDVEPCTKHKKCFSVFKPERMYLFSMFRAPPNIGSSSSVQSAAQSSGSHIIDKFVPDSRSSIVQSCMYLIFLVDSIAIPLGLFSFVYAFS